MINICCVQWGTKYTDDYVIKLHNSIKRNTSVEFKFFVFTDRGREAFSYAQRLLDPGVQTWYNKLQLFKLDYEMPSDQTFFFDLDTVIVGNLDNILSYKGSFVALRDFYRADGLGSGLMAWKTLEHKYIWDYYEQNKKVHRLGDQGIVEDASDRKVDRWQDLYSGEVVSYKVHCKKELPENARIVCFHGNPRPHKVNVGWMHEHWR